MKMREAACVIIIKDGLILAISRRDNKDKFGLVGGKVDDNENPEDAAIREAFEEAGITINECEYLYSHIEPKGTPDGEDFLTHCYYATNWSGRPTSSEEGEVVWLTAKDLTSSLSGAFPEYNTNALRNLIEKYPDVGSSLTEGFVLHGV